MSPGTNIRLITADGPTANGTMMAGLEIDLAPDTKTYWRVPGETGIPLQIDASGWERIEGIKVLWPMPHREITGGYTDHVYTGHLVLPIELEVSDTSGPVGFDLVMGVCSDICVPVTSSLEVTPGSDRDMASALAIRQATANLPIDWTDGPSPVGEIAFDSEKDVLIVTGIDAAFDVASLIASTGDSSLVFGAPQKSPIDGIYAMPRLGWGAPPTLVGQQIELIFDTPSGPYRVERTVAGIEQVMPTD